MKSQLPRSTKRAFRTALAGSDQRLAELRGDPAATRRAARKRMIDAINSVAATMPTRCRTKVVKFARQGVR